MASNENWRVYVEFVSGTRTDITAFVDTVRMPFQIISGDTAESSADSGGCSLELLNADQRFTPGNVLSPYSPNVVPRRRMWIEETVMERVFNLFTGFIDFPEITAWTSSNAANPRDQTITVPLVDLTAVLSNGRTLKSALAEHIIYNGGSDLKGFWQLTEQSEPLQGVGPVTTPMTLQYLTYSGGPPLARPQFATGTAPTGAEGNALRAPIVSNSVGPTYVRLRTPTGFAGQSIAASDWLTAVWWYSYSAVAGSSQEVALIQIFGSSSISLNLMRDPTSGVWTLEATGAQTGLLTLGVIPMNKLFPMAIRYRVNPAAMEFWIGGQKTTMTPSGAPPTGLTLDSVRHGVNITFDISSLQVYIGQTWGWNDYLTQINAAYSPLDRQSTGERIRTILRYAGVNPADFNRIDDGVAIMQPAQLAGRKPIDPITDAVETEQGEFWTDAAGLPVFADRIRLHNI